MTPVLEENSIQWLNEKSRTFLERGYLNEGVTPEQRITEIAQTAQKILAIEGFAQKFEEYMHEGFYALSSPVWANFGLEKGLPISCFGSYLQDHMGSILHTQAEAGMMSKFGGGTSGYFGSLRHRGAEIKNNGKSSGAVHFMELFENITNIVSQGAVRRGRFSAYLPVEHPDIMEFLDIGSEGHPIQNVNHAVTVTDKWLEQMVEGDSNKREIWAKVIKRRGEMGYPYIVFIDNANNNTVDVYKDKNLKIVASNLCSEIFLPSNKDWSFVCDLSSMNLEKYDQWKNTDAAETLVYFLDAVMSEFIGKLEKLRDSEETDKQLSFKFMERAYNFAVENRAIGVGVLGWHSLLQEKMLALESEEASDLNKEIFATLKEKTYSASKELAKEFGEPSVLKGYGRRNTTLMAIPPTTSSAFILGQVSQSIEPIWSNMYVKDIAKIKTTIKNPKLKKLLSSKGKDTKETWDSIRDNDGSVQHIDFLTDHEKQVFKTFPELDQNVIIDQAGDRQKYIDQGQSLNVMIEPGESAKNINALYLNAWKKGVKSLYYQHSKSAAQDFFRGQKCSGDSGCKVCEV